MTRSRASGFSLLELLIVVALIGVLVGTIVVTAFGVDKKKVIQADAHRLALAIELARGEAMSGNESWGLYVDDASYTFARFDDMQGEWLEIEEGPFARSEAKSGIQFALQTESIDGNWLQQGDGEGSLPDIVIFASGEQTPFEIELVPEWEGQPWRVRSDGIQRTRALQFEEDEGLGELDVDR